MAKRDKSADPPAAGERRKERSDAHRLRSALRWQWLRSATDRGATGDKVPVSDPAAAPLGTDAEAGGAVAPPQDPHGQAPPQTGAASEAERPWPQRGHARQALTYRQGFIIAAAVILAALLLAWWLT